MKELFGKANHHQLIDIGVCSLHAVHAALKTGEKKSYFDVSKVMKGSYYLLKDTPALREDYESLTGSTKYPVANCSIRWVENKKAGVRLLEIWSNIAQLVNGGKIHYSHQSCLLLSPTKMFELALRMCS